MISDVEELSYFFQLKGHVLKSKLWAAVTIYRDSKYLQSLMRY